MRWIVIFILMVPFSFALEITEIMYNPGSDLGGNYNEWIEIYSNSEVDLTDYQINGKSFDDYIINNNYLIIAENVEKFEEYFGNNNSVLDESYNVIDASSFSLDDEGGIVNISNGVSEVVLEYTNEYGDGNGKSIEHFNGSFVESLEIGGTPGRGRDEGEGIFVTLEVIEDLPDIFNIEILPDESEQEGIQVFPNAGDFKEIMVNVNASDFDYILVELNNETKNGSIVNFSFPYHNGPGIYEINVRVFRNDIMNSQTVEFEYMELVAFDFFPNELNFEKVEKGYVSSEEFISLENKGNVLLDFSMATNGLKNGEHLIDSSELECGYDGLWQNLSERLEVSLFPDDFDEIQLRVNVPFDINTGIYSGTLNLMGMKE